MIIHICAKKDWEEARARGSYDGDTLKIQGVIHCATPEQVSGVANYKFKGKNELVLLVIDDQQVLSEITYEDPGNGKLYPHIHGPLNIDAVLGTVDFPAQADGTFVLPNMS